MLYFKVIMENSEYGSNTKYARLSLLISFNIFVYLWWNWVVKRKKKFVLNHAIDIYNLLNLSIIWTDMSIYAIARYLGHVSLLITQRFESENLLDCIDKSALWKKNACRYLNFYNRFEINIRAVYFQLMYRFHRVCNPHIFGL